MTDSDQDILLDQTRFTSEEPFFEGKSVSALGQKESDKNAQRKKILLIVAIVSLLVGLLLIFAIIASRKPKPTVVVQPSPSPQTQQTQEKSELDQLFDEVNSDIEKADPLENILPFPPVDEGIRLTPKR